MPQRAHSDTGHVLPFASAFRTARIGNTEYTAGLEAEQFRSLRTGNENLLDAFDTLTEQREEAFATSGYNFEASLKADTRLDAGRLRWNLFAARSRLTLEEDSSRLPLDPGLDPRSVTQFNDNYNSRLEAGGDLETRWSQDLTTNLIGLYRREENDSDASLREVFVSGALLLDTDRQIDSVKTESIVRIELDYRGITDHLVELSSEVALNSLDNAFSLAVDSGSGFEDVPVPGANFRVQELRGSFSASRRMEVR